MDDLFTSANLTSAVREGRLERVREIICSYGLSFSPEWSGGYIFLREAIKNRRRDVAKLLLQYGAEVNSDKDEPHTSTALHFAVSNGDDDIVELLLDRGAYVDAKEENGRTPLLIAAAKGSLKVIENLLKHGADINYTDTCTRWKGYTPLHVAVRNKRRDVIELFLSRGANVHAKTFFTALYIKTRCVKCGKTKFGNIKIMKILLKYGADINSKINGNTVIHIAAQSGNEKIFKLLVRSGADINFKNKFGMTALHIAADMGHLDIVEICLTSGADVDSKNMNNMTALHIAAEAGNIEIIKILLEHDADFESKKSKNKYGKRPLDILYNNKAMYFKYYKTVTETILDEILLVILSGKVEFFRLKAMADRRTLILLGPNE